MAQCLSRSMLRSTTRTILSYFCDSKSLIQHPLLHNLPEDKNLSFLSLHPNLCSRRSYITEMRKSAFEGNILRLLRNEIPYALQCSPPVQPIHEYDAFTVDERPGEPLISLKRKFGESEEIKIDVSLFDVVQSVKKTGGVDTDNNVDLHIAMIVDIFKGDGNSVLEFFCSAWPNSIEILKCFVRRDERKKYLPFLGPNFKDMDDSLQDSLYDYLERRGINDELAGFLHGYMGNKSKSEYLRWMRNVQDFIGQK